MKKLAILLLTLTVSQATSAANSINCEMVNEMANVIVTARQDDVKLVDAVREVNKYFNGMAEKDLLFVIMKGAYSMPILNEPKAKKEAIEVFANNIYLQCLTFDNGSK